MLILPSFLRSSPPLPFLPSFLPSSPSIPSLPFLLFHPSIPSILPHLRHSGLYSLSLKKMSRLLRFRRAASAEVVGVGVPVMTHLRRRQVECSRARSVLSVTSCHVMISRTSCDFLPTLKRPSLQISADACTLFFLAVGRRRKSKRTS